MQTNSPKPWMKLSIIALIILLFVVAIFARRNEVRQPIAFSHKKHADNNVPCEFCHRTFNTTFKASIPQVKTCVVCHEDVIYQTSERQKIQEYRQRHVPIPWRQVYKAPEHVFFSHRLHTQVGKIACQKCHGEVERMAKPFTDQPVLLKMKNCIGCHRRVPRIANPYECINCHR